MADTQCQRPHGIMDTIRKKKDGSTGYHERSSRAIWTPVIGEELIVTVTPEDTNTALMATFREVEQTAH
jgi:hypothetical protein